MELLVTIAVLGLLPARPWRDPAVIRRIGAEVALRRLRIGLDRGRLAAERQQHACGLQLSARGWLAPVDAALPACRSATPLAEIGESAISLRSNLPPLVRFTANGLLLNGGVVVLAHPHCRSALPGDWLAARHHPQRLYEEPLRSVSATHCRPDDAA